MAKISLLSQFKGYRTASSPQGITPEYLIYAENLLCVNGDIQKRKKNSDISTATASTMAPNFWEYVRSATRYHFYKRSSSGSFGYFFRTDGGNPPLDSESSKFTTAVTADTDRFIDFVEAGKILYLFDDSTQGQKAYIDVSAADYHVEPIGLPPPSAPVVNNNGAGHTLPNGTYSYKITWVETVAGVSIDIESNGSVEASDTSAGTEQITITRPSIPSGYNITHWNIYRKDAGSSEWYYLTQVIAATSAYNNNDTTALDTQNPVPTRNTQNGLKAWYGALFKRRLWIADGDSAQLAFSELDQYEYFPADLRFIVGNAVDLFSRLIALTNSLVIFKQNSIWSIDGDNVNNFRLQKRQSRHGSLSPACTIEYKGSLYYQNCAGIWRWQLGGEPINIGRLIWKDFVAEIVGGNVTNWIAEVDPTHGHIWFTNRSSAYAWIYDPELNEFLGAFALGGGQGMGITGKYSNNPRLCLQGNTGFSAYYQQTGASEQTSESTMQIAGFFGMAVEQRQPLVKKQVRHIKLSDFDRLGDTSTATETISVRALKPQESLYGTVVGDYLLNANTQFLKAVDHHERAEGFGIYSTNSSVSKIWSLTGLELEYELVGSH